MTTRATSRRTGQGESRSMQDDSSNALILRDLPTPLPDQQTPSSPDRPRSSGAAACRTGLPSPGAGLRCATTALGVVAQGLRRLGHDLLGSLPVTAADRPLQLREPTLGVDPGRERPRGTVPHRARACAAISPGRMSTRSPSTSSGRSRMMRRPAVKAVSSPDAMRRRSVHALMPVRSAA